MKKIWIAKSILEASFVVNGSVGSDIEGDLWKRDYGLWNRACYLIDNNKTSFDLSDGIYNLNRSVKNRLKNIEKIYKFNKAINIRKKHQLEKLEILGLARENIIKKLIGIRNLIEHEDAEPPTFEECKELIDVVWYFLKSTDYIVKSQYNDFDFTVCNELGEETNYSISIEIDYTNHSSLKISGWFSEKTISLVPKENFISVTSSEYHGKEKYDETSPAYTYHSKRSDTDKYLNFELSTKDFNYPEFLKRVFNEFIY